MDIEKSKSHQTQSNLPTEDSVMLPSLWEDDSSGNEADVSSSTDSMEIESISDMMDTGYPRCTRSTCLTADRQSSPILAATDYPEERLLRQLKAECNDGEITAQVFSIMNDKPLSFSQIGEEPFMPYTRPKISDLLVANYAYETKFRVHLAFLTAICQGLHAALGQTIIMINTPPWRDFIIDSTIHDPIHHYFVYHSPLFICPEIYVFSLCDEADKCLIADSSLIIERYNPLLSYKEAEFFHFAYLLFQSQDYLHLSDAIHAVLHMQFRRPGLIDSLFEEGFLHSYLH
jgi:hypothetical protein